MKFFYLLAALILFAGTPTFAQWLDSSNKFNDSLHMEVCDAPDDQGSTAIVKGEDGGYFIIWVDYRSRSANLADIYAQKYDKDGKRLWAVDGVPVATSSIDERITWAQNLDYRKYSYAAPDGMGGVYICWTTDFQSYSQVAVQHLHSDGSRVFGDGGTIVGKSSATDNYKCFNPQLVPDSKGGFFIAYQRSAFSGGAVGLYAFCYKDEGGTLNSYGGGMMNQGGQQLTTGSQCGIQYYVDQTVHASVQNFMLYPDQQGGCTVVMAASVQTQQMYLAYNRLARVKKDCHTTSLRRAGGSGPDVTQVVEVSYKKDDVVRIYNYKTYTYDVTCADEQGNGYVVSNTKIENNGLGYLPLNLDPKYLIDNAQGVVLQTGGNINAELMSTTERALDGQGGTTTYTIHGYYRLNEIYDSIPYELCSDMDHAYQAYRPTVPDDAIPLDELVPGPDVLIGHSIGAGLENYTMTGSGNKVWVTSRGKELAGGEYNVYLQEMKLFSSGSHQYTFVTNTADSDGLKIGQEIHTSASGTEIIYNTPSVATDSNGHGLFYVMEGSRYVRVSPIGDGGILTWGAMGSPLGNSTWNGFGQTIENPHAVLSYDGKGLVAYDNSRYTGASSTAQNIWMERVSDVFTPAYEPPLHTLQALGTNNSTLPANYLSGSTGEWTTIQAPVNNLSVSTPVVSIMDNYALGAVYVDVYENSGAVRVTNSLPYLNRNITIVVGNNPHGSGSIPMRFYIPQAQFDALKAADAGISTPGDLGIIEQPNDDPNNVPTTYTPNADEQTLPLTEWGIVDGGYYIQFTAKGFSNFFIARGLVPLPLKWLDVQGKLTAPTAAAISWTVTEEKNVKVYTVQYSSDGSRFVDGCTTGSTNSGATTTYGCTVSLPSAGTWFFRVRQEDIDGKSSYSKTIELASDAASVFTVSPNPTNDVSVLKIPAGSVVKQLTLLSVDGKILWQTIGSLSGTVTIPMATLAAGVYHLRVRQDKNLQIVKIIRK